MAFTQTDAHNLRRALAGLNPRNDVARPSAQDTYDCLLALLTRAAKAFQMQIRDKDRDELRQWVDDLYRTQPQPGPPVQCMSWDYRQPPDLAELTRIIADVSGGSLHLREVDDSSDEIVIAVSRQPLDDAAALAAWEASR